MPIELPFGDVGFVCGVEASASAWSVLLEGVSLGLLHKVLFVDGGPLLAIALSVRIVPPVPFLFLVHSPSVLLLLRSHLAIEEVVVILGVVEGLLVASLVGSLLLVLEIVLLFH